MIELHRRLLHERWRVPTPEDRFFIQVGRPAERPEPLPAGVLNASPAKYRPPMMLGRVLDNGHWYRCPPRGVFSAD